MLSSHPTQRIVLFAATSWEFRAVAAASPHAQRIRIASYSAATWRSGSTAWTLIEIGVGPTNAAQAAEAVLASSVWDAAISTGFAAGLRAPVGRVLLGTSIRTIRFESSSAMATDASSITADPALCDWLRAHTSPTVGAVLSVDRVVGQANDKQAIAERVQDAVGLDMESAALAAVAQRQRIPFAVLRTVSDGVDESLPLDFNAFFGARATAWTVLREAARAVVTPGSISGLLRLGQQSRVAGAALTGLFARLTDAPAMLPIPAGRSPQGAHV